MADESKARTTAKLIRPGNVANYGVFRQMEIVSRAIHYYLRNTEDIITTPPLGEQRQEDGNTGGFR